MEVPLIARFGIIVFNETIVVVNLMLGRTMFTVPVSEISTVDEELDYHDVKKRILDRKYAELLCLMKSEREPNHAQSV